MIYVQDTIEKCIFPEVEDNPFSFIENRVIDTVDARVKTLEVIESCKEILSVLDRIENDR